MSSLDAFSLSSILLCFVVITAITFVVSQKLSSTAEIEADVVCCANCGAAEVDDIKLEECDGCDLVKYCTDKCRQKHRPRHKKACKKRARELHDKELFTQPDGCHHGECPICFLPLPIDPEKSYFKSCCSETVCRGCSYANFMANRHDEIKANRCPFCREVPSKDKEVNKKKKMKRVEANVPAALCEHGTYCYNQGNPKSAFEYWTKAVALGDLTSHFKVGVLYMNGEGVEKDEKKAVYHYEIAAIGGHPWARYNLATNEERNGNIRRAVKHYIIAAKLGEEKSMKNLWDHYSLGNITKEELDATLRAHRAAIDETKSEQREAAEKGVLRLRSLGG